MNEQGINEWVTNARTAEANEGAAVRSVKVVRNKPHNRGAIIMAVADALRPHLNKLFEGSRDDEGMLAQPAHIRAYALNMAQYMVQQKEAENNAA